MKEKEQKQEPRYKKKCYICGKFFEVYKNDNQVRCKECARK